MKLKTAVKIARKLLISGVNKEEIIIVASDIDEYAPIYKLFLKEYKMKGFSSVGTSLNSFSNSTKNTSLKVRTALSNYYRSIKSLEAVYKKLGLPLSNDTKLNIKTNIKILDEKIGIELTEPNQLVGLKKKYKHIIFYRY